MNNILIFVGMILAFGGLVLAEKYYGEAGVIGFMVFATIMANIMVCKSTTFLGITSAAGNVMFASNFLATDILTEKYGVASARKGVKVAVLSSLAFLVATQILVAYIPNEFDLAHSSMATLFALTPRITLASVFMFAVSNFLDVNLYEYLRVKMGGKHMWVRNNVSTMLCNGAENFIFGFLAFGAMYDTRTIIATAVSGTIIEIMVAACDTPFLYIATKEKPLFSRLSRGIEAEKS